MSKALTKSEQDALFQAMANFGPCTCTEPGRWPQRTCDGHRFIAESTKYADRLDTLLYVRRTRQRWVDGEFMEPVVVVPEADTEPAMPAPPDALPW